VYKSPSWQLCIKSPPPLFFPTDSPKLLQSDNSCQWWLEQRCDCGRAVSSSCPKVRYPYVSNSPSVDSERIKGSKKKKTETLLSVIIMSLVLPRGAEPGRWRSYSCSILHTLSNVQRASKGCCSYRQAFLKGEAFLAFLLPSLTVYFWVSRIQ